jgi:hypothetical protein
MNSKSRVSTSLQVICSLLIFLFVYTAVSKLTGLAHFKVVLSHSPLIGKQASLVAFLLPPVELTVAALLFLPGTRQLGLLSSIILMAVFTIYIAFMLLSSSKLPCSCGGVLNAMNWKEHLLFNICFTLIAFLGWLLKRRITLPNKQQAIHPL